MEAALWTNGYSSTQAAVDGKAKINPRKKH